jgi:hypothetical protein
MDKMLTSVEMSLTHLRVLHSIFTKKSNFDTKDTGVFELYKQNEDKLVDALSKLKYKSQLYSQKGRQMILADIFEYIFLGRIYYSAKNLKNRPAFIRAILHFCNMLMCYEAMTVSPNLREKYLNKLKLKMRQVGDEDYFDELKNFKGTVGLPLPNESKKDKKLKKLNEYFDTLLPKTAGGLWHELIVYIFLLRNDCGYIVPLLLSQKLLGNSDHLVPPDFLVITKDKRIYGIEVGIKKEIQSGNFSLRTAIPTAMVDTINSRTSDRCPICRNWITICPYIIEKYSDMSNPITKAEISCVDVCNKFTREEILVGKCPHTKYARNNLKKYPSTHHDFADRRHYHYRCILEKVDANIKALMESSDEVKALKSHFPYYAGIEYLFPLPQLQAQTSSEEGENEQ